MNIEKPIFLVGSGRSGTTALYHLLSSHPQLCWFSNYTNHLHWIPMMPVTQRFLRPGASGNRLADDAFSNKGRKFSVRPAEGKKLHRKLGLPANRLLTEADFDPAADARYKNIIKRHLYWSGKPRFISKDTLNNPRCRLLNHMFPDALFIHLIRDGRAVANSMVGRNWLPILYLWWLQDKAINHVDEYEDPIELIGQHWRHTVEELRGLRNLVGNRYLELRYEDLIEDVHGIVGPVLDFAGLDNIDDWLARLPTKLPNMNTKWRENFTPRQIELLNNNLSPLLSTLSYSP